MTSHNPEKPIEFKIEMVIEIYVVTSLKPADRLG